jgi:hypothetical protein
VDDTRAGDAHAACNKLKAALLRYITNDPNSDAAKFVKCAKQRGTLKDPILDCRSYAVPGTTGAYLPDEKIIVLPIEYFMGLSPDGPMDAIVDAYMPMLEHELVHAIDAGRQFSDNAILDRMIREARAYGWAERAAGNDCDCRKACDLAWQSVGIYLYFKENGGKPGALTPKEWMAQNKDKYVGMCSAECGTNPGLDLDKIPKGCGE